MKRKDYEKPTIKIYKVKYQPMILAGSDGNGGGMPGGKPGHGF
jgi:hypothetical protein